MHIYRKSLRSKSGVLTQLNFSGRLLSSESMYHENQLAYKCEQLKNDDKIHSTWFCNNTVNVKRNKRTQPAKIHHVIMEV